MPSCEFEIESGIAGNERVGRMERDRLGRRRSPEQERGLRPLHPLLPEEWISKALRVAMSESDWAISKRWWPVRRHGADSGPCPRAGAVGLAASVRARAGARPARLDGLGASQDASPARAATGPEPDGPGSDWMATGRRSDKNKAGACFDLSEWCLTS